MRPLGIIVATLFFRDPYEARQWFGPSTLVACYSLSPFDFSQASLHGLESEVLIAVQFAFACFFRSLQICEVSQPLSLSVPKETSDKLSFDLILAYRVSVNTEFTLILLFFRFLVSSRPPRIQFVSLASRFRRRSPLETTS